MRRSRDRCCRRAGTERIEAAEGESRAMEGYRIHGSIHPRPPGLETIDRVVNERQMRVLDVRPEMLAAHFPHSFEQAAEQLQRLPRLFFEPDGSFVWVTEANGASWQLDGVLYDRNGFLQFVDVHGEFTRETIASLLEAVAGTQPVMFQLAREAVFVDQDELSRVCRIER